MVDNKINQQEKLNRIKEIRKNSYDNSKNQGAMIFNKVEYLGKGEKTKKELYRAIELYSVGDNETEKKEFFYELKENDLKLIGVRSKETGDEIIPTEYVDGNEFKRKEWEDELQDIERCIEERDKELRLIAKELGIDEKDINSISEVDLEQKIEDKEKENQEEEQDKDEPQEISEEEAEKIGVKGSGMNSVKMNSLIDTKGNTLGKELNLEEYDSLIVVHSYKLANLNDAEGKKGKVNNMNFDLVGKKSDGTLEVIPETKLKRYTGGNRRVAEHNTEPEERVEVKNEECIFEVPNTNKRIAINRKDYGIPEVYYGKTDKQNGMNVMESVQDERDGTQKKNVKVREIFNSNKGEYHIQDAGKEAKEHQEVGCEEIGFEEADGDRNTGHIHFNPENPEQLKAIEEIVEKSGSGPDSRISKEEAERLFASEIESSHGEISIEEAKENVIDNMNDHIRNRY